MLATSSVSSSVQNGADYAAWTGVTGSTQTVTMSTSTSGSPYLAGVQFVAPAIVVKNAITVSASSTLKVGSYQTVPLLEDGTNGDALTVANGSTLSFATNGSSTLQIGQASSGVSTLAGTLAFTAAGETLSLPSGFTLQPTTITDNGGNGFNTTGAGNFQVMVTDNSATLTGPVNIGTTVQGSTGSGVSGIGSALGTGALVVQSGGDVFGSLGLNNSSITINSGGLISGTTASANTTGLNTNTVIDNGTIQGGSFAGGTVRVGNVGATVTVNGGGAVKTGIGGVNLQGNTTVGSGSASSLFLNLNVSTGETLTASGTLTLAGGNSAFSLYGGSTTGLINVTTANSLFITGTHEIDAYSPSSGGGVLPSTPGQSSTYDLINYTGTLLTTTGGSGAPLVFTGMGQGGELTFGPGSTPGAGQLVIPPSYLYRSLI